MTKIWLIYRSHRTLPHTVEILCVLSDGFDELAVLNHHTVPVSGLRWERIGPYAYNAYDDNWEYVCQRWGVQDTNQREAC